MQLIIENYFLHNMAESHIPQWAKSYPNSPILKYKKGDLVPRSEHFRTNMGEVDYRNLRELYKETKKRCRADKVTLLTDSVKIQEKTGLFPLVQLLKLK